MSATFNVGERVRMIRESRNLTRDELAGLSRLSRELIISIEESRDLPFLAPLVRIARTLGVRLSTFLEDTNQAGPAISRNNIKKPGIKHSGDKTELFDLNFHPLASGKAGRHMEPHIIDIKPSAEKKFSVSSHQGEEFIYVLTGAIEVIYGDEKYQLQEGDSIYYESIIEHHVHTATTDPARILAVVFSNCN
jgi:transcriptional regulator with XRE-family HTH domain